MYSDILEAVRESARKRREAAASGDLTLKEALESMRAQLDMTQRAFAAFIGMDFRHYGEVLAGKRMLTLRQAMACYRIGVQPEVLLGGPQP